MRSLAARRAPIHACAWECPAPVIGALVLCLLQAATAHKEAIATSSAGQLYRKDLHSESAGALTEIASRSMSRSAGREQHTLSLSGTQSHKYEIDSNNAEMVKQFCTKTVTPSYIPLKECNSMKDLLKNMVADEKHFHVILMIIGTIFCLVSIVLGGILLGSSLKVRPPKYWKNRGTPFKQEFEAEIDVTDALREPIQQLLDMTTIKNAMGVGRDGAWATHKGFRVRKVTRVESGWQWHRYSESRKSIPQVKLMLAKMQKAWRDYTFMSLKAIEEVHGQRDQIPSLKAFLASLELDHSRNERILFHGSPAAGARQPGTGMVLFPTEDCSPMHAIKKAGFDDRLGNVKGMYGSGTYFADMASKADQYAGQYNPPGTPHGSIGEVATMFLARVTLGCPYMTNQSLEQLRRPPCCEGHFDLNLFWNEDVQMGRPWREKDVPFRICDHQRFDSVMADWTIDGQRKLYREFVVYDQQAYPEFCVEYERMAA